MLQAFNWIFHCCDETCISPKFSTCFLTVNIVCFIEWDRDVKEAEPGKAKTKLPPRNSLLVWFTTIAFKQHVRGWSSAWNSWMGIIMVTNSGLLWNSCTCAVMCVRYSLAHHELNTGCTAVAGCVHAPSETGSSQHIVCALGDLCPSDLVLVQIVPNNVKPVII